ncbi:hypothetical protein KUV85_05000 [Nocardioides panacisoli]|uniref:hypothetical protein n=1 Tax=Nocardioides panacisoli TaxID=627624 RepID=UPI001C62E8DA|nr:hypothetical protein [Nocardioides panacisoli]QYJ05046.1 hypothetical protein KUV85_05000 [Nocardioides panacisoli]
MFWLYVGIGFAVILAGLWLFERRRGGRLDPAKLKDSIGRAEGRSPGSGRNMGPPSGGGFPGWR